VKTYPTFEQALRRVEQLKLSGVWPGIIDGRDGYTLTWDPGDEEPGRQIALAVTPPPHPARGEPR